MPNLRSAAYANEVRGEEVYLMHTESRQPAPARVCRAQKAQEIRALPSAEPGHPELQLSRVA